MTVLKLESSTSASAAIFMPRLPSRASAVCRSIFLSFLYTKNSSTKGRISRAKNRPTLINGETLAHSSFSFCQNEGLGLWMISSLSRNACSWALETRDFL